MLDITIKSDCFLLQVRYSESAASCSSRAGFTLTKSFFLESSASLVNSMFCVRTASFLFNTTFHQDLWSKHTQACQCFFFVDFFSPSVLVFNRRCLMTELFLQDRAVVSTNRLQNWSSPNVKKNKQKKKMLLNTENQPYYRLVLLSMKHRLLSVVIYLRVMWRGSLKLNPAGLLHNLKVLFVSNPAGPLCD